MLSFVLGFVIAFRILKEALKDPAFRTLTISVIVVLAIGTTFYPLVEDWSVLDSLYFSITTLTTVGFGDLSPETTAGKIFTMMYIIFGLGFLMAFVTTIVQRAPIWAHIEPSDEGERGSQPTASVER